MALQCNHASLALTPSSSIDLISHCLLSFHFDPNVTYSWSIDQKPAEGSTMAIMSSTGKSSSSSLAAMLLLLVAVVAATCASGAQASFNITNLCNKTVVITTGTGANSTLPPGGSLQVDVPPNVFLTAPVTFTITGTGTPPVTVTIHVPQFLLNLLNDPGVQLQKIEIRCVGNCVTIIVTYKPPLLPPVTMTLGPFCP